MCTDVDVTGTNGFIINSTTFDSALWVLKGFCFFVFFIMSQGPVSANSHSPDDLDIKDTELMVGSVVSLCFPVLFKRIYAKSSLLDFSKKQVLLCAELAAL